MSRSPSTRKPRRPGRPPSIEGRVSLNITLPPDTAQWLKTQGNASATIKALVDAHIAEGAIRSAQALDAARYRAIRKLRVGSDGPCEIWNVAYVGHQLDQAVDAVIAADPYAQGGDTWICPACETFNRTDQHRISCRSCGRLRPHTSSTTKRKG